MPLVTPHRVLRRRPGAVLIYFALVAFALFAIAGLVIDMGFVRLTQMQMQAAADMAALEGVRLQDTQADADRRQDVSERVALFFDDDLDPSADPRQFGAGPIVTLSPGAGAMDALRTLSLPAVHVYRPQLAVNASNQQNGDMVAGQFDPANLPDPAMGENPDRLESSDYTFRGFTPDAKGSAFLVRLRRTSDSQGLDNVADVSTSGPPLPLLFGRGSLVRGAVRQDGIIVRAVAIAAAVPVWSVGQAASADSTTGLMARPGVTPFGLSKQVWSDPTRFPLSTPVTFAIDIQGQLAAPGGTRDGQLLRACVIGRMVDSIKVPSIEWSTIAIDQAVYVPIFDVVAGQEWIIGFGRVTITSPSSGAVILTKFPGSVAAANASASLIGGLEPNIDPVVLNTVLERNRELATDAATRLLVLKAPRQVQ